MKLATVFLVLAAFGCGEDKKKAGDDAPAEQPPAEQPQEPAPSPAAPSPGQALIESLPMKFATEAELPGCTMAATGRMAFVTADISFRTCNGNTWEKTDIRTEVCHPPGGTPATKLRRGITKEEVLAILGEPKTAGAVTWFYESADLCTSQFGCRVTFSSSDDLLSDVSDIKPAFVDLAGF